MSDRRLLDGDATEDERRLLEAARADGPPDRRGRHRTLAALGVGVVGLGTVTSTSAAASWGGKVLGTGLWAKVFLTTVGTTALLGTVTVGVRAIRQARTSPAIAASVPSGAPSTTARRIASRAAPADRATLPAEPIPSVRSADPSEGASAGPSAGPSTGTSADPSAGTLAGTEVVAVPPVFVDDETDVDPRSAGPSTGGAPAGAMGGVGPRSVDTPRTMASSGPGSLVARSEASTEGQELAEQVRALDGARAALVQGRYADCRARLDAFEQRYPSSALRPEAKVIRVKSLLAEGRVDEAKVLVRRYREATPNDAYRRRLEALVGPE